MTGTTTTCRELYQTDPGFRGFIHAWVETKRCPLELADYLMEQGIEGGPVEAVRWAATEPQRPIDQTLGGPPGEKSYSFPGTLEKQYWWYHDPHSIDRARDVSHIPDHLRKEHHVGWNENLPRVETVEEALVWLLDNWGKNALV